MRRILLALLPLALIAIVVAALAYVRSVPPQDGAGEPPLIVASIPPLGAILAQLAAGRAEVHVLLPAGASPHGHELRPSDARAAASALMLVYVDDSLDPWAAALAAPRTLAVLPLLPEELRRRWPGEDDSADAHDHDHDHGAHDHGAVDPHFWLDPIALRRLLPLLAEELAAADPAGADRYRANAAVFNARLSELHLDIAALLAPLAGAGVVELHPSFGYFLDRYHLHSVGVLMPVPGVEPRPSHLQGLIARVREAGARAVIVEPQLDQRPAKILSEEAGLPLLPLDPLGGASIEDLLRRNAQALAGLVSDADRGAAPSEPATQAVSP